ncbi:MAG: hypothetical protein QOI62_433 [Solirubrobacteraceae bacterium]|jgi:PBP1b-binding outer membrane lipoprotein LpoB|nr:hypothetical protein [Solirubrobacteraceae bacterium]MEA2276209.1 hypothetical protein [Solirubrobacteraceae bacterium]MEA2357173.1 hypothetical protein [Solirubrobacteraceae bacterium]
MLHRRPLIVLALVLAAVLAGCTTQRTTSTSSVKFTGDQRLVANTVADLQTAASKGNQGQICRNLLAQALVTQLAQHGGTCERAVRSAIKDTDLTDLSVLSVSIQGTRATAQVKFPNGKNAKNDRRQSVGLVKQGTVWRIASFG